MTEFLDISMELGCFLAGALLSTQGHMVTAEVTGCIEPIRDFLAIIFFASIGRMQRDDLWQMFILNQHFSAVILLYLFIYISFFFCVDSAGLHVFPTFVLYELTILVVLTLSLVIMKVLCFSHLLSLTFDKLS